jgi:hypothetical protein
LLAASISLVPKSERSLYNPFHKMDGAPVKLKWVHIIPSRIKKPRQNTS